MSDTKRISQPPTFSKLDVDRVLRRAAEIEGSEEAGPISAEELRSIAGEAGFGKHAVELAIREARETRLTPIKHPPVEASGLVVPTISARRTVQIEISSEQLMRAVRLLQPYREGPAQIRLHAERIHWRDRKGLSFTVTSTDGVTEMNVSVTRPAIRRGRLKGWVKSAADRLEALVLLVATQSLPDVEELPED